MGAGEKGAVVAALLCSVGGIIIIIALTLGVLVASIIFVTQYGDQTCPDTDLYTAALLMMIAHILGFALPG